MKEKLKKNLINNFYINYMLKGLSFLEILGYIKYIVKFSVIP